VQTELLGGAEDPRAMPLKDFIAQTIELLKTEPTPAENKGMEESFNRH
jgi:uncharacterized oxidoreductase